jgi:hypothetical protein
MCAGARGGGIGARQWPKLAAIDEVPMEEGNRWWELGPEVEGAVGQARELRGTGGSLVVVMAGPLRGRRC